MAQMSLTEQDWNERAMLFNYRCRACRSLITFADQQLYFSQGACSPCFQEMNEQRHGASSPVVKRIDQIRSRRESGAPGASGDESSRNEL